MSKKVTLSADGATATTADATASDIVTTALSTTEALTGMYGKIQQAGLFLGGMVFQSYRSGGGLNPFAK